MTRKFEVKFSSQTALAPSFVYISPSPAYQGHFAVGILYASGKSGNFQSTAGIAKTFDFEQNLCKSEVDAIHWVGNWLSERSGGIATLNEVTN